MMKIRIYQINPERDTDRREFGDDNRGKVEDDGRIVLQELRKQEVPS